MNDRIPEYLLERLAAGDLPPRQASSLRLRLGREPDGGARLDALQAEDAAILANHPPAAMAEAIRKRARPALRAPRRAALGFAFALPATAIAAFGLLLWLRAPGSSPLAPRATTAENSSGERIKGLAPRLMVYRHRRATGGSSEGGVERLSDGALARAGDELQLAYVAAGHRFGAVLSVDGGGQVTSHLAGATGGSVTLRTDGEVALPEAYQLDAAPGYERFAFVTSDAPISGQALGDWFRALSRAAAGSAPRAPVPGAVVAFFTVRKEAGAIRP